MLNVEELAKRSNMWAPCTSSKRDEFDVTVNSTPRSSKEKIAVEVLLEGHLAAQALNAWQEGQEGTKDEQFPALAQKYPNLAKEIGTSGAAEVGAAYIT